MQIALSPLAALGMSDLAEDAQARAGIVGNVGGKAYTNALMVAEQSGHPVTVLNPNTFTASPRTSIADDSELDADSIAIAVGDHDADDRPHIDIVA